MLTDHLQLISKTLPRQLKLTNQKTPCIIDVEMTEKAPNESDEENVSIPSDPENLLNGL